MTDSGLAFKGRPNTDQEETMRVIRYCGGSGGGECIPTLGATGIVLAYRVPKYITYNRKIVFHNPEFTGVRIYTDGGVAGLCSHSLGTAQDFWIGLAADPGLDIETTAKAGLAIAAATPLPYDLEFNAQNCPQPTDPAWENIVYVYIYWGNSGFVNEGGAITTDDLLLIKHDKDSRI